ncbi:MAG TPA: hypothetical protein VID47_02650 [Actinomycetota bacterium]
MQRFQRALVAASAATTTLFLLGVPGAGAATATTSRVTQHGSTEANGNAALPSVSATGQFVAYESGQTNLVGGAGSSGDAVFWWNRKTGTTKLVSHGMGGQPPDGQSFGATISADGRYVAFESEADNLVPGDGNGVSDAFRWDSHTGTITVASVNTAGDLSDGDSGDVSMSPNGRYVAFSSGATNLGPGDHNAYDDVYVRDMTAHTTTRASVPIAGHKLDGDSIETCMSNADIVGFGSRSHFLVSHSQPDANEVYVRNIPAHTTKEVSVNASGAPGTMNAFQCDISANGRYVAFDSYSGNLSSKDGDASDVFLRDVTAGKTYLASIGHDGSPADDDSTIPSVSDDGRFVAFQSEADNLIPGDGNHQGDAFRYDRTAHTTKRLSVSTGGQAGDDASSYVEMSGDGSWTVFTSSADNLVPHDTAGHVDVFERGPLSS